MQCLKRLVHVLHKSQCIVSRKRKFDVVSAIRWHQNESDDIFEEYEESDEEKHTYTQLSQEYLGNPIFGRRVFVIQPYIKWGSKKKRYTTPNLQLAEAVTLVKTLPNWTVVGERLVPLMSLEKKQLVGSGTLVSLKTEIANSGNPTAIFVSTNLLKFIQISELQNAFQLPVFDRYSLVIHIFREHAKTPEAKLQVALAEIPYIKKKMTELSDYRLGRINFNEKLKNILQSREKKLRTALKKLKEHRHMIKKQRQSYGFPSIAVVGYTNAGKTSLIKALTGDASLQPEDKLFATLDTTVHQGLLLNKLKVLYVDTIGFIQDVPETLIEPFLVTLEDALTADIIIHVFDISHPDAEAQIQHVQKTITSLVDENKMIINVANKCDMIEDDDLKETIPNDTFVVSASKSTGIDLLRMKLEKEITNSGNIVKKRIRVKAGSAEASWLYKETTVLKAEPDPKDAQKLIIDVFMTTPVFYKFKRVFNI
ncbi:putative GTP-binding protein 6 [Ceratina calcarata]|uniref:GTP-binding protein 6 n=1 Tax=Ceratina calcarata TaxID=156304 RepID=A0AAJ7N528_9HYME|nr:putative GTP-binding protein 6 [Ceratina calcarata]